MRILAGFLVVAATWAQPAFQNLAPTGDGSTVYFSSLLRMKGTTQYPDQPKIFVWTEKAGVQLYEQKPPTISSFIFGWQSTTAYNLIAPSVSSDGRTVAITGLADCNWGTPCTTDVKVYQSEIRVAGGAPLVMDGPASVSPNGTFAGLGSPIMAPSGPQAVTTVLDLANGQQQHPAGLAPFPRRHGVANNGTVIEETPTVQVQPWSGTPIPVNVSINDPVLIDAAADRLFFEAPDLTTLDVATGTTTVIAPVDAYGSFDITDDGSLVAFVQDGQIWTVHGDGSGLIQIPNVPSPVVEVALSGSGSHIFAITNDSRILRINLTTLAVGDIVPATPIASGLSLNVTPGGVVTSGSLVEADSTTQPIPAIQSISLFEHDLPVLSQTASQIELEIPYDIPNGNGFPEAVLKQQSDGPFESAMLFGPVQVSAFDPTWFTNGHLVAALHQDFSGPITAANPAHPGEIIHAYGFGFGPVTPEPPLGKAASVNPLSRTTTPLACGLANSQTFVPGQIWYAGLAPGWIGLYQLDIRLPSPPPGSGVDLVCGQAKDPVSGNYAGGTLPMSAN